MKTGTVLTKDILANSLTILLLLLVGHKSCRAEIDIRNYGCRGDGKSDNSVAFERAVNDAVRLKTPLFVPSGEFLLTSQRPIRIEGDLLLRGNGPSSRIIGPGISDNCELFVVQSDLDVSFSCKDISFERFYRVLCLIGEDQSGTYDIELSQVHCDQLGAGLIGVPGGTAFRARGVRVLDCKLSNMGLDVGAIRPWAIDIALSECRSVTLKGNIIDKVGSKDSQGAVAGIWVDCTPSADKSQPVMICNNTIRNVCSSTNHGTDQVVGILVLEAKALISGNLIDSVIADRHPSSPEAIYTKCSHAVIEGNAIVDCCGREGVINMKGELSKAASSERSLCVNNSISFRSEFEGMRGTAINCGAPAITCSSNIIDGTQRGIVVIYDGTILVNNVLRATGTQVELVGIDKKVSLVARGNVIQGGEIGILATCPAPSLIYLLEVCNNSFANVGVGVQVLFNQRSEAERVVIRGNTFHSGRTALALMTLEPRKLAIFEYSFNSMYDLSEPVVINVPMYKSTQYLNSLDGSGWERD